MSSDRLRLQLLAGLVPDAGEHLAPRLRRGLALASALGAPLLPAVEAAMEAEDDDARARRAVAVSTAQARTVARGLMLAPVVLTPLIARLAGADALAFYRTPVGSMILLIGGGLLLIGGGSARMLITRAARPAVDASLEEVAELVAVALGSGVGTATALRTVADAMPEHAERLKRLALDRDLGVVRAPPPGSPDALLRIHEVLEVASGLGAPAAPTLRRLARDLRAAELSRILAGAERLPAQLALPTTLLLLPATLLLVGAPLVASGLAAVLT